MVVHAEAHAAILCFCRLNWGGGLKVSLRGSLLHSLTEIIITHWMERSGFKCSNLSNHNYAPPPPPLLTYFYPLISPSPPPSPTVPEDRWHSFPSHHGMSTGPNHTRVRHIQPLRLPVFWTDIGSPQRPPHHSHLCRPLWCAGGVQRTGRLHQERYCWHTVLKF